MTQFKMGCPDGHNAQGVLPFTVILNGSGAVARVRIGETTFDELVTWATQA